MHYFSNTWNRGSRSNSDRQNSRGTPSSMKIIRIDIVFTDEHYMGNPFRTIRSKWSTTGIIVIYFRQAFILWRHLTIMFAFDYFLSTVSQGEQMALHCHFQYENLSSMLWSSFHSRKWHFDRFWYDMRHDVGVFSRDPGVSCFTRG